MSATVQMKSVNARMGEVVFFFVLVPALLFFMLFHMDEGGTYLLAHGEKLAFSATAEDFLRQFPDGDISYQLKFAVDYVRDGSIATWVLNLWPPGMPVLYGLVLKMPGSAYFPLKIIVLATALYAIVSYFLYRNFSGGRFSVTALIVSALPLMYGSFQNSLFLGFCLFSSDFYCFVLLAILMFLLFEVLDGTAQPVRRQALRLVMLGAVLAALAYFRSFYFIYIKLLTAGSLFALVAWVGCALVGRGWKATIQGLVKSKIVASVGVVLLVAWLVLLPWKLVLQKNQRPFDWTATNQVWAAQWRNDLPPFLVGLNTPCVLDRNTCEQLMPFQYPDTWAEPKLGSDFYKRLSVATFVSNPLAWYAEKAKVFRYFWFDAQEFFWTDAKYIARGFTPWKVIMYIQSVAIFLMCIGLTVISGVRLGRNFAKRSPLLENNGLYVLFLSFFGCNLAVFTFLHYEARYSIPLKWVTYLVFVYLLKDAIQKNDLRLSRNNAHKGAK